MELDPCQVLNSYIFLQEKEIDLLKDKGAKILTLGNRILRTETAGFTAVAMAQLLYGDMGGK